MGTFLAEKGKGLLLCLVISVPAWLLGMAVPVVGGPIFGILLGMVITLFIKDRTPFAKGIGFTSKYLLQTAVVQSGTVSTADLLAGYGAAQAVPGPLFSFAAYLGAMAEGPLGGWAGGLALLVVIFLPALLVLVGVLPFWESLRPRKDLQASIAGVNAGVVGILLAALYDPVWTSAIHDRWDVAMALVAFGLLVVVRAPTALVVLLAAVAGWTMA